MKSALVLLAALSIATVAEAGVELRPFTVTLLPDGTYHYSYRIKLVSGRLDPGSPVPQIVTIYDVPGVIPGSVEVSTSAPWGGSLQYTGTDAADIPRASSDNPSVYNVTLKFTGASVIHAPAELGSVGFRVPTSATGPLLYVGQSTSPYRAGVGLIGRISGPGGK